ncbi:MAG: hypothetical protein M3Y28_06345 [Armatimonadota bacterium]|nr:hypothetical protein [Armatimonadota bacterium]
MRLDWSAVRPYDEVGGRAAIETVLDDALTQVPREHRRQLDAVTVLDKDPKGIALGVYRQDRDGARIELYLGPHLTETEAVPESARRWVFGLMLAHTLFHEIGHHVTLHLNRRAAPPRKKAAVTQTLEKWAEEYVAKRLQRLCDAWLAPGGAAAATPEARQSLILALHVLHRRGQIHFAESPPTPPGTISEAGSSNQTVVITRAF